MNDATYEFTFRRKLSKKEKLDNLGLIVAGIVGIFISLVLFNSFAMIPVTAILVFEYFVLLPRRSIEVEYSFFDGILEISYIYNQEKRKTMFETDIRNAEIIAPTDSEEIKACCPQKELDYSSGVDRTITYSIIVRQGSILTQVIIEPDEKMRMLLRKRYR